MTLPDTEAREVLGAAGAVFEPLVHNPKNGVSGGVWRVSAGHRNDVALLVNGLGVNHPEVIRSVAAAEDVPLVDLTAKTKALVESLGVEGSKALYLYDENKDNTHTSAYGATVYAGLVRDELLARHLVPRGTVRVG